MTIILPEWFVWLLVIALWVNISMSIIVRIMTYKLKKLEIVAQPRGTRDVK